MSELYAPGSELDQGGSGLLAPDPLSVDASAIDKNLRAIQHVEAAWRLPSLPDEVRFDLASLPGMDHRTVTHFLYGTERDAFNENDEQFNRDELTPTLSVVSSVGQYGPVASSGFEDSMAVINSLRGLPAPQALDADAVQRWKLDAIDKGYMKAPEDGVVDSTWSPELSALQRQMQHDSYADWQAGDRPGAVGFGKGLEILSEWTSPSGLMRMATELDLFWDAGQISKEVSSWGDKWRKLGDSDGPLDFAKNLFDALTGPIDDVVIPALNMALMFSGVGAATNFGRMTIAGTRASEAVGSLSFLNKMYEVPKLGTFLGKAMPLADAAAFDRLGEASWTAQKLLRSAGSGRNAVGKAMAGWRDFNAVKGTRGIVQTGMRLGFISQVENSLLPNYKGGASLSDIPAVADFGQRAQASRWMAPFEILFTPYTMFAPGTFTGGGKAGALAAAKFLGTVPGRATVGGIAGLGVGVYGEGDTAEGLRDAAIGAGIGAVLPGIGQGLRTIERFAGYDVPIFSRLAHTTAGFGRALAKTSFKPIAEDQLLSKVFMDAQKFRMTAEQWAEFEPNIQRVGFLKAQANHWGIDEEAAAAAMTHVVIAAAIDRTAALQANLGGTATSRYRQWMARNKLTAQIRVFGDGVLEDESMLDTVLWTLVQKQSGRRNIVKRFNELKKSVEEDPDAMTRLADMVANHNEQAALTMRQLLSPDNLPVHGFDDVAFGDTTRRVAGFDEPSYRNLPQGDRAVDGHYEKLTEYVAGSLDTFGNWPVYQPLTHDLFTHASEGSFALARLKPAISKFGKGVDLKILESMPEYQMAIAEADASETMAKLTDIMVLGDEISMSAARKAGVYINPLAFELTPTRTAWALARTETAHKAEYLVAANEIDVTLEVFNDLRRARQITEKNAEGAFEPIFDKLDLGSLTSHQINQTLKAAAGTDEQRKSFRRVHEFYKHMATEGIDVSRGFEAALEEFAGQLGTAERWTRFKQQSRVMDKQNKILSGLDALKQRSKQLKSDAAFVAAEVDKDDLLTRLAAESGAASYEHLGATWRGHDAQQAAIEHFDSLPDDADVWLYHGTTPEGRDSLISKPKAAARQPVGHPDKSGGVRPPVARLAHEPDGLFVAPTFDDAANYGSEVVRFKVKKSELVGWSPDRSTGHYLMNSSAGAVVRPGVALRDVRVVKKANAMPATTEKFNEMKAYFDQAESQGYRVVHGADFLMPDELMHVTGLFKDINERHMNAMTLGNFFGRRHPTELAMNVAQARMRSIAKQLSKTEGRTIKVDDEKVQYAMFDLHNKVLNPEMATNKLTTADLHHQGWLGRVGTALKTSEQPGNWLELGRGASRKKVMDSLQGQGWTERQAAAIWQGVKEARYAEFKDMGLAAIEQKLRGRSQLMDVLHVLGGTPNGKVLRGGKTVQTAIGGALLGAGAEVVNAGLDSGDDIDWGNAGRNALIGAGARPLIGLATRPLEQALDLTNWARYGYLADGLATFRDRMRFSLSPFFDMSRYTEAYTLGQIAAPKRAANGERLTMPLNQSPRTLRKRLKASAPEGENPQAWADMKMKSINDQMRNAARGKFDPNQLESTGLWFEQTGVLGFNPTAWMGSSFHYLKEAGMDNEKAWETVRDMYTYGTRARSAFEQSVNFVFFPFSFIKKTGTHMASWLADDLSRAVLVHDTYKMYQLLDENYDLGAWVDDHAPALRKLQQLNMFAFGISPGKLGGVNAPFLQAFVGDPTSPDAEKKGLILNLMSPQGVNAIGEATDTVKRTFLKTVPAINDLMWMYKDLQQQGHVIMDPTHQTQYAQSRDAFAEWSEYKKGVAAALQNVGATWYDLRNNAGLKPLYDDYRKHQAELNKKYPGWGATKAAAAENSALLAQEREFHRTQIEFFPEEATLSDAQFVQLELEVENAKAVMAQYGFEDLEDMPPEVFDRIRLIALQMVQENPAFLMVYRKMFERDFGLLTSAVQA